MPALTIGAKGAGLGFNVGGGQPSNKNLTVPSKNKDSVTSSTKTLYIVDVALASVSLLDADRAYQIVNELDHMLVPLFIGPQYPCWAHSQVWTEQSYAP